LEQRLGAALAAEASGQGRAALTVENAGAQTTPPEAESDAVERDIAASATSVAPLSGSDDAPWPIDESGEAMFAAAVRVPPAARVAAAPTVATDESKVALPALDTLVHRIPAEVRETLEDLFRAKFTAVRRVPAQFLNEG
jgi:hypothetical protein